MFQNIQTQVLAFACHLPLDTSASLRSSTPPLVEAQLPVNCLVCPSLNRAVQVKALARETVLCVVFLGKKHSHSAFHHPGA